MAVTCPTTPNALCRDENSSSVARCRECGSLLSTNEVDRIAMASVMEWETNHGREPRNVSGERVPYMRGVFRGKPKHGKRGLGYDIESVGPGGPRLIEVKGHAHFEKSARLTESEIRAYHDPKIQRYFWIYFVDFCHTDSPQVDMKHIKTEIQMGGFKFPQG